MPRSPHDLQPRSPHEIETVQALRGVACLLVVAYHAIDAWGAGGSPRRAADAIWANGAAGVDLFFVISGFVMALSAAGLSGPGDAARFAVRRWRRVVPLYWTMTCAKLAVLLAWGGPAMPGLWHVATSLLFIPARDAAGVVRPVLGVGWTLQFEMLFYALVTVAVLTRRRAWHFVTPLLVPLAVAGFFRRADWPAPLAFANGLVLEFCFGMALASALRSGFRLGPRAAICAPVAGAALLLILPQPGPWRFLAWGGPAILVLAGAVALDRPVGARLPRWLLAAGDASFAIYLLHPFLVPVVARLCGRHLPPLIFLSLVFSGVGGLALHRYVDRPLQRLMSGRRRGSARPVPLLVQP